MKKGFVLVLLVVGGWLAYSYFTTGKIGMPSWMSSAAEDDQGLGALATRLSNAESVLRRGNRVSSRTALDTREADGVASEANLVLDALRGLTPQLKTDALRSRAKELEARAQQVLQKTR
jgi:hypothetical protein